MVGLDIRVINRDYPVKMTRTNWEFFAEIQDELYEYQKEHVDKFIPFYLQFPRGSEFKEYVNKMEKLLFNQPHWENYRIYRHSIKLGTFDEEYEFILENPQWADLYCDWGDDYVGIDDVHVVDANTGEVIRVLYQKE